MLSKLVPLIQGHFYLVQIGMGAFFLISAWNFIRPKTPESGFRVREADRNVKYQPATESKFADAKIKPDPLRLSGISLDGRPHEVLGVRENATAEEVQKAYRDLMKRYHPDKVGRPGTREWQDAQKIAETINRAKTEMLKK